MPQGSAATERRRQTHNSIYRRIYESPEICTKQSLARDLKLSLPTIYQHLSELIGDGLVAYSGEQCSTGGRRAAGLTAVDGARIAVGVSVMEDRLRFVAADLRLRELAYRSVRYAFEDMAALPGFLSGALETFLDENGLDRARLLGLGVSLPAVISADGGSLVYAPTLQLRGVSLAGLSEAVPYPVYVENDGVCGGFAECFLRRGARDMAYLSLESGVGGAVLLGGRNHAGDDRRSGEFGHMCVEPGGLPCSCGKRGCLEAYCSARRISEELGLGLEDFFSGLERREPEFVALWEDLLRHLAIGVNSIRMVLDCEVVLGGILAEYLGPWLPKLRGYVLDGNPFETGADFLQLSVLRRHTAPLGAALLFIQEFLDNV